MELVVLLYGDTLTGGAGGFAVLGTDTLTGDEAIANSPHCGFLGFNLWGPK